MVRFSGFAFAVSLATTLACSIATAQTAPSAPATQPAAKAAKPGPAITNSIGMKLVAIPPGTFIMGSPADEAARYDNETQHKVTMTRGFFMGATSVTQAQWRAVMGTNPSHFKGDDLPVEQVSWDDAVAFCKKLSAKEGKSYHLPTEAQWEYACRAGTTTPFNTGVDDSALTQTDWYGENSKGKTHPVGLKKPNAWGLYDMHGNVLQWCNDWYAEYPPGDATDPTGPPTGTGRVLRGGAWLLIYSDSSQPTRSAHRDLVAPETRMNIIGFRVVRDL